jgi:hypothetical protein
MPDNLSVPDLGLYSGEDTKLYSRFYQRLEEAMHSGREVSFRLPWGGLIGVPIYLDETCVEIVYVHVADRDPSHDLAEELSRRTVWLIRLAEISALAFDSESWSKQRLEQLLPKEEPQEEPQQEPQGEPQGE